MARDSPDRVDCVRLAEDGATLTRAFALRDLPRLQDLLAQPLGVLHATFVFAKTASGAAGATVTIETEATLVCQRCLRGFELPIAARSEIEFTSETRAAAGGSQREPYDLHEGLASLRELAEEELLLALPLAPACGAAQRCRHAPAGRDEALEPRPRPQTVRPFSALQDMLKKTDRT